ncbi:MAG: Kelch repeat-containing protein [bacterium]
MLKRIAFSAAYLCFLLLQTRSLAQNWSELTPASGNAPLPRRNAAAVYDVGRHRLIIFGGRTDAGDRNDVWAFDLNAHSWAELSPATGPAPAPRFTANAVYDSARHQVIIWSGQGAGFFNDVWAYDLHANVWSQFNPPAPIPNVRYGTASVFDPRTRDLVTFAGFTDQGRFEDTWRFEVDRARWREVSPAGAQPGKRCLHAASYDRRHHRMIIYGGQNNGALRDIWAFDLNQNTWANLTPTDTPAGRWFPTNIYDARHHRILIFGGNLGSVRTNDVWAFDLKANAWQQLSPGGMVPSEREGAAAVYIEAEDRMIVFGGVGVAHNNEVWALDDLSAPVSVHDPPRTTPQSFRLLGNYPNPFNPSTVIAIELPAAAQLSVKLHDTQGRLIKAWSARFPAGRQEVVWEGTNQSGEKVASGVYLYHVRLGNFSQTGKMLLSR